MFYMLNLDNKFRIERLTEITYHIIRVITAQIINKNTVRDDSNNQSLSMQSLQFAWSNLVWQN